jgi:chlorite dismutase
MQEQPPLDIREKGRNAAGETIYADRRLYMQLLAFGDCPDPQPLIDALNQTTGLSGTLYLDLNDPTGVMLVTASENPDFFLHELRPFLANSPFSHLETKPDCTMLGRSYAIGYESDLDHVLVHKPVGRITDPAMPWAVWYPLRRTGSFEKLDEAEQRDILSEHGRLGALFAAQGHGVDIRLACHGLDFNDNDFVIGLIGPQLHPLSIMVQTMRRTRQTSEFLEALGPFLIGKAIWQRNALQET